MIDIKICLRYEWYMEEYEVPVWMFQKYTVPFFVNMINIHSGNLCISVGVCVSYSHIERPYLYLSVVEFYKSCFMTYENTGSIAHTSSAHIFIHYCNSYLYLTVYVSKFTSLLFCSRPLWTCTSSVAGARLRRRKDHRGLVVDPVEAPFQGRLDNHWLLHQLHVPCAPPPGHTMLHFEVISAQGWGTGQNASHIACLCETQAASASPASTLPWAKWPTHTHAE